MTRRNTNTPEPKICHEKPFPLRLDADYSERTRARAKRENRSISFVMRQVYMFGLDTLEAKEKAAARTKAKR